MSQVNWFISEGLEWEKEMTKEIGIKINHSCALKVLISWLFQKVK